MVVVFFWAFNRRFGSINEGYFDNGVRFNEGFLARQCKLLVFDEGILHPMADIPGSAFTDTVVLAEAKVCRIVTQVFKR